MSTIEIVVESGPMWAEYSAAIATLLAATGAGAIAWRSISNRKQADIKAEWWRRVQYAIDKCHSKDLNEVGLGITMLGMLSSEEPYTSQLDENSEPDEAARKAWDWNVTPDDRFFISELMTTILDTVFENTGGGAPGNDWESFTDRMKEVKQETSGGDTLKSPEEGDPHG